MAVDLPSRRQNVPTSVALATYPSVLVPRLPVRSAGELRLSRQTLVRALEIIPGAAALLLISSLVWGYIWFPTELAVALLVFDVYWLWKSWTIAYHVGKGVRLMRESKARNWRTDHAVRAAQNADVLAWDEIRHVVIIPNYKESVEKLRATLYAMAQANGARKSIILVLAMEETEGKEARRRASVLRREFAGAFLDFLVTYHPANLHGEVRGKSSNEAWAARECVEELVDRRGLNLDDLTVTSCDADTIFPPQYFDALTYYFATDPKRYLRFWQAPIFFYNNIWQVPAPLRVPNALGGLVHLSRLSRKRRVLFSQSTYSLSMRMAHDVGYWDTDVIPEDWHMFLKCFYALGGDVDVEPIHLPVGNDGALSHTARDTYINQYLQVRRWGWGAVDVPYAAIHAFRHQDIPLKKRLLRLWYFVENHLMWSTQWFFITLGGLIPQAYHKMSGGTLTPTWFSIHEYVDLTFLPLWFAKLVTIPAVILTPCLIPYAIILYHDWKLRPLPPKQISRLGHLRANLCWLLISPITFLFSALPALDSQVRLMLGKRMEYRVTEKV
jgi:hypothetical protein